MDAIGAVLSVVGLGRPAFGLVEGRTYGWVTNQAPLEVFGLTWSSGVSPVFVSLVLSVALLAAFVWCQIVLSQGTSRHQHLTDGRRNQSPMAVKLFSISSFSNGNIANGIGVGFATAQVTNVVLADVPADEGGQSSAIQSTLRQLGSALGIAALTTTFFSLLSSGVESRLAEAGLPAAEAANLGDAVTSSASTAIGPLAANPQSAFAADAACEEMPHALAFGATWRRDS